MSANPFEGIANHPLTDKAEGHQNPEELSPFQREMQIVDAIPQNFKAGFVARAKDAWERKGESAALMMGAATMGTLLSLALRSPFGAKIAWLPEVASGLIAVDVGRRLGMPMLDTWLHPETLEKNKVKVGSNLGAMALEYPALGLFGGLGVKFGPPTVYGVSSEISSRIACFKGLCNPAAAAPSGSNLIALEGASAKAAMLAERAMTGVISGVKFDCTFGTVSELAKARRNTRFAALERMAVSQPK